MPQDPMARQVSVQEFRSLLAPMNVVVGDDEAESLALQATPYFVMLERLMRVSPGSLEPAVTFAVDRWLGINNE